MTRTHVPWLALPVTLMLGCQQSSPGAAATGADASLPPSVVAAPAATADAAGPHARASLGRHAGIAGDLFLATRDLSLTPGQQDSLDKIDGTLKEGDDGVRTAMHGIRSDLQAGIKADKIDTAKLSADEVALDKAVADMKDKEATALDTLHATLSPAERATLVANVRAKRADEDRRIVQWLNADAGAAEWGTKRVDQLTTDLSLDATQKKQVAAILARSNDMPGAANLKSRWDDVDKRKDALLSAFEGATFDSKKLDLSTLPPGQMPREMVRKAVSFVTQLLPILHPDQRDKLATSLDQLGARMAAPGTPEAAQHPIDEILFPFSAPQEADAGAPPGVR